MPTEKTIRQDVRVDRIGYVQELKEQYADPQKDALKDLMRSKRIVDATGEIFDASLVTGTSASTDVKRFFRMYKTGEITEAQFIDCISVRRADAKKLIGEIALNKMSTITDSTPQLTIKRKKGVDVALVDAVKSITTGFKDLEAAAE